MSNSTDTNANRPKDHPSVLTVDEMRAIVTHEATQAARIAELEAALNVAMKYHALEMPGDSRAVPDWFVSCASVQCGLDDFDGAVAECLDAALTTEASK